mgnify:CR=1 FL=1
MIKYEKIDSKECSMKIELVDIDKAFKYYQINDINYKNRCYKCIEDINTIEDFNIKTQ